MGRNYNRTTAKVGAAQENRMACYPEIFKWSKKTGNMMPCLQDARATRLLHPFNGLFSKI